MLPTTRISRSALIVVFILLAVSFSFLALYSNSIPSISNTSFPHISSPNAALPIYDIDFDEILVHSDGPTPWHPPRRRANATLVMLARNSEVNDAVHSVRVIEDRFNYRVNYPWVFLNEEPFSDDFKRRVSNIASGDVRFGQIPDEHWYQPSWINETKATEEREKMVADNIIYGGSVPYRNMCRFNSGFFYRHPLLQDFRYYWRVEPGVHFHCDVHDDPFVYMHENDKIYGFTISLVEFERTIETLWSNVRDFVAEHPEYIVPNNSMSFLSDNGGTDYNLCHFWSNFEIADMDFWRGEAYTAFFDYLDHTGGFYYERWGDAPVHSIAVALFAGTDRIHFFREIGYSHSILTHCPAEDDLWERGRCTCDQGGNYDYTETSCTSKWDRVVS